MSEHTRVRRMVGRKMSERCLCGGEWPCEQSEIAALRAERDQLRKERDRLAAQRDWRLLGLLRSALAVRYGPRVGGGR